MNNYKSYRVCKLFSEIMVEGIEPESWLLERELISIQIIKMCHSLFENTYRSPNAVSEPIVEGMGPESWLPKRELFLAT